MKNSWLEFRKDIRDLKKAKIALNKLGKSRVIKKIIEVIEDIIIELNEK